MPGLLNRMMFLIESRAADGAAGKPAAECAGAVVDIGSATVRYLLAGAGPSVVFATDFPMVVEHYGELVDLLAPHVRVVVFEVPGFGFSKVRPGFGFDFYSWNETIVRFLRILGPGPHTLVFPCVAAFGAIHIASQYPDLVRSVVLLQAPSWQEMLRWKTRRDPLRLLSTPLVGQALFQALKRRRIPDWLEVSVGDKACIPGFLDTVFAALDRGAVFSLASAFQSYLSPAVSPAPPLEIPTLLIWGDADESHARTDKDSSTALSRNCQIVHIAEAGHYPELETPRVFAQHLIRFVGDSTPRN